MNNSVIALKTNSLIIRCHTISKISGYFTLTVGIVVILGWIFDLSTFKSISASWASMKINTAICFLFLGVSILALLKAKIYSWLTKAVIFLAATVIMISGLTLYEYIFNQDLGIDQLILKEHKSAFATFPGRMYYLTALNLFLCSLGILGSIPSNEKLIRLGHILTLIVFLMSLDALFGYSYGSHSLYNIFDYNKISLHTNITFLVASIGILFSHPQYGFTKIFLLDGISGSLAWRLIPSIVLIPPALGFIALGGQKLGFYDSEFRIFIIITAFILIFTFLIWNAIHSLHDSETKINSMNEKLGSVEKKNRELLYTTQQLEMISSHDSLTGLANRTFFHSMLENAIERANRHNSMVVVFFLDLDYFKEVNDKFGHDAGDKLLIEISRRLKLIMRISDTLARIGGDEFTVILEENITIKKIEYIAKRIIEALNKPFYINQRNVFVTTSIGISCYPNDGLDLKDLIKHADVAMYQVKNLGGNNFRFYNADKF